MPTLTPDHKINGTDTLWVNPSESVKPPRQELAIARRPGISGLTVRKLGERGQPFAMRSLTDTLTESAARSTETAHLALIGNATTIKAPDGQTYNVIVLGATCERFPLFAAIGHIHGAAAAWAVQTDWRLEYVT